MSVGIFRFDDDEAEWRAKKETFCAPVCSEEFYTRIWTRAITEKKIKLFKDSSEFSVDQVETVVCELQTLLEWCEENLSENSHDYFYMHSRLENLITVIPEEASKSNHKFYIF